MQSSVLSSHPDGLPQTCNGQGLKKMARAGLAWLETHYEVVNSLNVFPVPDGDTGTNMLLTMRSAYKEIANSKELHAGKIAQMIYQGALMGARGNSGVILSQLWRGFSSAIEDKETFDTEMIASGFEVASQTAYRAVQEPVEGTILTVAREVAAAARLGVQEDSDIVHLFEKIVTASRQTVERTPEMLAVLREAGVVDFGRHGIDLHTRRHAAFSYRRGTRTASLKRQRVSCTTERPCPN